MVSFGSENAASFGFESHYPNGDHAFGGNDFCKRCHVAGVDVKMLDCGCYYHSRCCAVKNNSPLTNCPVCHSSVRALMLMPMKFDEIDGARAAAANMSPSVKRGKKRKNATIARLNPSNSGMEEGGEGSDLRTGRWTTEETLYCDKLVEKFEQGELPISDGIKLNDFLSNMLKSKQSRLTKKMKNARLSAKTYARTVGFIQNQEEAKQFSELEISFFDSIQCDLERSEIRFHMQKEWRELFSSYCVAMGQSLDADQWLSSVEEMDRRASQAKDSARMARRKVMMGYALSQDSRNREQGVFIERPGSVTSTEARTNPVVLSSDPSQASLTGLEREKRLRTGKTLRDFSSPFVGKVIQYLQRHNIPFEHIDAWVPSFVPGGAGAVQPAQGADQKCRLCFAGFETTETQVPADGGQSGPLSAQDQFDLLSFGEYSQKFSFDVGCGLPGRVYSSGICSWEQGVENAPSKQFERCGGASQWGIKTVLGIPIPSPNVGRIVILLYSRHDRRRDPEMVRRITEELTKLMPTPKWKLVVDVGAVLSKPANKKPADRRISELLKLMTEFVPTHKNSPYAPYLPGFTSLPLLLVKQSRTQQEFVLLTTILDSYSSYLTSGRSNSETAWMIARDYMLETNSFSQPQQLQPPQQPGQLLLLQPPHQQQQMETLGMPHHQEQNQHPGISQLQQHGSMGQLHQQSQPQHNGVLSQQQNNGVVSQQQNKMHSMGSLQQQQQVRSLGNAPIAAAPLNGSSSVHQNDLLSVNHSDSMNPSAPAFSVQHPSAFHPMIHRPTPAKHHQNTHI